MAAGDRSDKIRDKVKTIAGLTETYVSDVLLFILLDEVQRDVAQETLSIESTGDLTIVASTASYTEPTGFYRSKKLVLPSGMIVPITEIDYDEYDRVSKLSTTSSSQSPIYFTRWSGSVIFYPTPSTSGTYTWKFYKIPSTNTSTSIDPETPARQDTLLFYGVMYQILPHKQDFKGAEYYRNLYISEMERQKKWQRGSKSMSLDIYSSE